MDDLQREVVELLAGDARLSDDDLAEMTGEDADAVREAREALEDDGTILGYQAVVNWEHVGDGHVRAEVEVNVELDRETSYEDIARRIVGFDEVNALRLVSGNYDFSIVVEGDSMNEVSLFISEKIAPIPAITQTVTHFVMDTYKERGLALDDESDDDRLSVTP